MNAKLSFTLMLAMFVGTAAFSQSTPNETHEYLEIKDDPEFVADKLLSLELCGPLTFSKGAGLTLGIGLNGLWALTPKVQAQGTLDFLPIQIHGGMGFGLEFGPALTLTERTKEKEVRVVLKYSDRSYNTPTERVRETSATWLNVTATYLTKMKVRGGAYVYKTTFENEKDFNYGPLPYTMAGIYGGFELSKQAALISQVDGRKGITSGLTRIYVDVLVLPLRSFGALDVDGTIRSAIGGGILGGRIGFQTIFNPNKSKNSSEGRLNDYQVFPKFFFKTELGYRPAEGVFWSLGGGLLVWKNR